MNSLFPLAYSFILFLFLSLICYFLVKQIINIQAIERKIFELQESVKKNNASYDTYYKLGQLYLKKKLFSKSILLFRKALTLFDKDDKITLGNLYNTLGFTYFTLKKYELAIYYYEIATEILPDYTLSLTNLAYACEKENLILEAYTYYTRALFYDPRNTLAFERVQVVKRIIN